MNRPIYFIEAKSPEQWVPAENLAQKHIEKTNQAYDPKNWALYVNNKRWDQWKANIKPRSKILLVNRRGERPHIKIVREETGWLILNKPAGLPTQATFKAFEENLYENVRYHYVLQKKFPKDLPYVGLHHRLDRGTSGLVLMTKKRSLNKAISDLFKYRKIQKEYLCYTEPGEKSPPKKWTQEDKIARAKSSKRKFSFEVSERGDQAISEFELLERKEGEYNLILCRPKTGRTHQLRVQLSHRGYAILGDAVYGSKKSAPRLMLHAQALSFRLNGEEFNVSVAPQWALSRD
jgi:23S rRNA-/tRNA-specific pseudouridylate synthase